MIKRIIGATASLLLRSAWRRRRRSRSASFCRITGVGAELAQQQDRGMELYLKIHADAIRPYKITLIKRDAKNPYLYPLVRAGGEKLCRINGKAPLEV